MDTQYEEKTFESYFNNELKPRLFESTKSLESPEHFEPVWMSSTYAVRHIDRYRQSPDETNYYYKECAINARSPDNEADDIERAFLRELNANPAIVERE